MGPNCRQLFVRQNWLTSFPEGVSQIGSLEVMGLTRNQMGHQWISEVKVMLPNTQVIF